MGLIGTMVLSAAVTTGADKIYTENDAKKITYKALYIELNINEKVKILEERYLNKDIRKYGSYVYTITRIIQDKRISYQWSF